MGRGHSGVDEGRPAEVQVTMGDFAKCYDYHQSVTGHRKAMANVLAHVGTHFGNTIVDLGCGTAYPMRDFFRNVLLVQFRQGLRNGMTRALFIDSNQGMLERAKSKLEQLVMDSLSVLG
ncbi:MAG: hypothetical protein ABIH29_06185, partial [Candidatus Micrarchaeota archaeon]